jgi:hypothetical protein
LKPPVFTLEFHTFLAVEIVTLFGGLAPITQQRRTMVIVAVLIRCWHPRPMSKTVSAGIEGD